MLESLKSSLLDLPVLF